MTYEILSGKQMKKADELTIRAGMDGYALMRNAGRKLADRILAVLDFSQVRILCGHGNNGGDGFVAAVHLKAAGKTVFVYSLVPVEMLTGDAAKAAKDCTCPIRPLEDLHIKDDDLVIDSLFGTGFHGEFDKNIKKTLQSIENKRKTVKIAAVDIPSGVSGCTATAAEGSLRADITITFARKKIGHCLYPGKGYCGTVFVEDIGITDDSISQAGYSAMENGPDLWKDAFPKKQEDAHKYIHGSALIHAAPHLTGATRLAAEACARSGAGLTTVLSDTQTAAIYKAALPAHIIVRKEGEDAKASRNQSWQDKINVRLVGPGGTSLKSFTPEHGKWVIDADALYLMSPKLTPDCVITPHEGEFSKIRSFQDFKGSKLDRARLAAKTINAIVVLKGADTVIVSPDGHHAVINTHTSPYLASAGTGDVLSGMITGLIARNMQPFEAACAAVWIHGEAARETGPGLVAGDLIDKIPAVLHKILEIS